MAVIDIIVPVYRVEKYLHRCLDSLVNQTFSDIHLILVDDGSDDHSPQICDEYAARYDNIDVIHKPNGGQSSARNSGLDVAHAPYVMFVDSDDYLSESACERVYHAIKAEAADVASFGMMVENEQCVELGQFEGNQLAGQLSDNDRKRLLFMFSNCVLYLYRRDVIGDIRFPHGMTCEDYYFTAVVASRVKRIVRVDEPLYHYRTNPNSTTHKQDLSHAYDKFLVMDAIIQYYRDNQLYDFYRESLEYLDYMFCFANYCKNAVISYEHPSEMVMRAWHRMKDKRINIRRNRFYKERNALSFRFMAAMIEFFPHLFMLVSRMFLSMRKVIRHDIR